MSNETKRQLKQPRKDALRDWLRDAANTIQEQAARLAWWEEHHEQAVDDALAASTALPGWGWLVLAALGGGFVVAVIEAVLA
jgi:hypothetical protein